jgi:hypothetical protein
MRPADMGSTLEALAYWALRPNPDGTKNAPFTITSPSVLQFQSFHSPSSVSTRFVTCQIKNQKSKNKKVNNILSRQDLERRLIG